MCIEILNSLKIRTINPSLKHLRWNDFYFTRPSRRCKNNETYIKIYLNFSPLIFLYIPSTNCRDGFLFYYFFFLYKWREIHYLNILNTRSARNHPTSSQFWKPLQGPNNTRVFGLYAAQKGVYTVYNAII